MPDTSVTLHGRCSACRQVLLLPTAHITSEFSCPTCNNRARGIHLLSDDATPLEKFGDGEDEATRMHLPGAPDDVEMPREAHLVGEVPSSAPPADPGLSRFEESAEDQATRIHVPLGYDEAQETANSGLSRFDEQTDDPTRLHVPLAYEEEEDEPDQAAQRSPAASHMGSSFVAHASPSPASPAASRPQPATRPVSSLPGPIQLPGSLPDEQDDPFSAQRGFMHRLGEDALELSVAIDQYLGERRHTILAAAAIVAGVAAPLLDAVTRSSLESATVMTSNFMLFTLWLLAYSWLGQRRNDSGYWELSAAGQRLLTRWRLIVLDLSQWTLIPRHVRLLAIADLLMPLGLLALTLASTVSISRVVWGWPETTSGLFVWRFGGTALVLLSMLARRQATPSQETQLSALGSGSAAATAQYPAVVDLSGPIERGANGTPIAEVLRALSHWQPAEWANLDSYRAAVARHLLRHLPWADVNEETQLLPGRRNRMGDLTLNDAVLLRVRRGFDEKAAQEANAQMQAQARTWGGKPTLLVLFETPPASLRGSVLAALESLHESFPLLVVRMPTPGFG